ncbi:MAG: AAA family ATPase [Phormidesmis sp. RL_2_1]|nr:AAA family ATPase [Phormidesmis sp. RL_2_1]
MATSNEQYDRQYGDHYLNIVTYNKNSLNNLRRAVVLGQGQFSLILARVNYRRLRRLLLHELSQQLRLAVVQLPRATTRLREAILNDAMLGDGSNSPQAIMVTGIESIRALEPVLKAANLGRDELPKTFNCPVVLWVNDAVVQHLNRYAPDLKSFAATPIRFEYPAQALVAVLTAQANNTFQQLLESDEPLLLGLSLNAHSECSYLNSAYLPHRDEPIVNQELTLALAELDLLPEQQDAIASNELIANFLFLQGRNWHQQGHWVRARQYYESSLKYWQQQTVQQERAEAQQLLEPPPHTAAADGSKAPPNSADKTAVLLFHLGLWWRSHAIANDSDYTQDCKKARQYFEACLAIFRQRHQTDRLGRFMLCLAEVLQKLKDWPALAEVAQMGISLHQHDSARLARDYGYLAEVALARYQIDFHLEHLSEAQGFAQQALEISDQAVATTKQMSAEDMARNTANDIASDIASNIVSRYHRGGYWYSLAIAQQLQGQTQQAISHLEKARSQTDPRDDFALYRRILDRLWHLYFQHQRYADAFDIKLTQRRTESLFGLRAFIGASQIQPMPRQPLSVQSPQTTQQTAAQVYDQQAIAPEIRASGRTKDIEALVNRLSQPRYPIVVVHGQSGVGKSSVLSAGLVPQLQSLTNEGRTTLAVMISTYGDWFEQIINALTNAPTRQSLAKQSLAKQSPQHSLSLSSSAFAHSPEALLALLQTFTRDQYQQVILIFDQFEDFFYEHPEIDSRYELYGFLRDCLNLPYVKVVLSLREDFLHYLLEWDRIVDLNIIDNDILSKEIRYYLGNFMPKSAEMLIRQLTQSAKFYLEEGLITTLVDDLAAETGDVSPIELQVVGAQLQREKITTLAAYQALGPTPKNQLLKNFLDNVIHDCGPENSNIAKSVLYLLSEGSNRPLKSFSELEEAIALADTAHTVTFNGTLNSTLNSTLKREYTDTVNPGIEHRQLPLVLDILTGSGLIFEVPEVSGVRYQLAHEYIATLVQQQQPTDLIEALQTERHRRQLTEAQLEKALAAHSDSVAETTLARQRIRQADIKALLSVAKSLQLSGDGIEALTKAMRAAKQIRNDTPLLKMQTALCLHASLRDLRERNELLGHRNWVLAVHTDHEKIASASDDGTIKLWSHQGTLIRTLNQHQAGVLDIRFSPDGQHLASASLDQSICLWRANGDFIRRIECADASVTSISFSPTEPLLAAAYSDAQVRLWHLDGTLVRRLTGHEDWVRTVAFSPDGSQLATGSEDQTVRLWSVAGEMLAVLQGQRGWVRSVAFSPDGSKVVAVGDANAFRLWSVQGERQGQKLRTFYGHQDWVRAVAFSPDGQRLASASDDQTIRIWDLNGTVQQVFNQRSSVHSLAWQADGESLVSGGDDDQVHIWWLKGPLDTGPSHSICGGHMGIVWSACWQPLPPELPQNQSQNQSQNQPQNQPQKPRLLLSAGGDEKINIWNDQGVLLKAVAGHRRGVHSVVWSPDGEYFASASADYSVRIWTKAGTFVRSLLGHEASVWQVSYSPDGSRLASVSSDRTLRLWSANEPDHSLANGHLLKSWADHTDTIWHVSFSPDGQHLITASEDNTLRLWHHQMGLLQTVEIQNGGAESGLWCATFSPNGAWIASGGADGIIRLWPVHQPSQQLQITPEPLLLRGHRDWVRSLSFSPSGDFLASASDDGTVRLWPLLPEAINALRLDDNATISQLLPPLTGHEGVVWDVNFDPTGERLVSASADGTMRIWDLRLEALMKTSCDWLSDWLLARPEQAKQLC